MSHSQFEHDHELLVLDNFRAHLYHRIIRPVLAVSGKEDELIQSGRDGGYYGLYSLISRSPQAILQVGGMHSQETALRAHESCQEMYLRLAAHPEHGTSRESRDPERGKYAGAVRGQDYIHSFAGLSEDLNEITALLIGMTFGDISFSQGRQIRGEEILRYLPIVEKALQRIAA